MNQRDETIISIMHDITGTHMGDIGQELSDIEDLLAERRLLRKWVQDSEGADLFSEDLARVEAELAEKEGKREELLEEYNRLEHRLNWLKKQLEIARFRLKYESDDESEDVTDDNSIPF